MADAVQELLIKYSSDISPLVSQGEALAQEFRKMTQAAETSSKAVEQTLNKQAALIDSVIKRLEQLRTARDNSAGDPARIERINALISDQQTRLDELRGIPPLQIISPDQLGIIEQARASLQELKTVRDQANDPNKVQLLNQLIAQQESELQKLTALPKIEIINTEQLGILESAKVRLQELADARDKATDPGQVAAFNKLIAEQVSEIQKLTELPQVTVIDPSQVGLIEQARTSLRELAAARDASNDPDKINLLNQLLAEQEDQLRKLTTLPPLELVPEQQLGILEQARVNLQELATARDKADNPEKIQLLNTLIAQQEEGIRKLTELPPITVIEPEQLGIIQQARVNLEELTSARDASTDPEKVLLLNRLISEQNAELQKLTSIPPAKIVDASQVGLIENLRNRLTALTAARDKSNDPAKIIRLNSLIEQQEHRLRSLQGVKAPPALDPNKNNILGSSFDSLGRKIAAVFAVDAVIRFGIEAVKAFEESEKAAIRLGNAVSVSGGLQSDFQGLLGQAKELQSISIFSDETIANAQTAALQFGLTKEEVEQLIPIVVDFASATGQDLGNALNDVLQGVNGMGRGLKQFGITVDDTGNRESRLKDITEQLTRTYQGQAEVIGNTASGAAAKYNNALNEQQEIIGSKLSPLLQSLKENLLEVASGATDAALLISDSFSVIGDAVSFTVDPGGFIKTKAAEDAAKVRELMLQASQDVKNFVDTAKKEFQSLSDSQLSIKLEVLQSTLREALNSFDGLSEAQKKTANENIISYRTQIAAIFSLIAARKSGNVEVDREAEALSKLKDIASLTDDELRTLLVTLKQFNDNKSKDAVDQIEKELEARKKSNQELFNSRKQASEQLAELDKKLSEDLLKARASNDLELLQIERDLAEQQLQILFDSSQKTIQDKENLNDALLSLTKQFGIRERELIFKREQEKSKQREDAANSEIEQAKARFEATKTNLDTQQQIQVVDVQRKFVDDGNFSPEAIEERDRKIFEIEQRFNDLRIGEQQKFTDEFIKLNDAIFDSKKKTAELEINKIEADLFATASPVTGLPDPTLAQEASDKIIKITTDLSDEQIRLAALTQSTVIALQNAQTDAEIAAILERFRIGQNAFNKEQELAEQRKALENEIVNTVIDGTEKLISDSLDRRTDAQLEAIEERKNAELQALDELIEANDERNQKGIIGDREAQRNREQLLAEKRSAEDRAAKAEATIKRKQFQNDQKAAVAKVVIANIVNAAEFPALAAFYAGLAIAQSAIILAEPNPYAKGTKKAKPGLSMVGEEGIELMNVPEGTQVLSHGKTKKKQNAEIIDAMFDDKLESHVQKVFVEPALREQAEKLSRQKETGFVYSTEFKSLPLEQKKVILSQQIKRAAAELNAVSSIQHNVFGANPLVNLIDDVAVKNINSIFSRKNIDVFGSAYEKKIEHTLAKLRIADKLNTGVTQYNQKQQEIFATNIANTFNQNGLTRKDYYEVSTKNRTKGMPITNANEIVEPLLEKLDSIFSKPSYKR